jgi:hypothetical protein
MQQFIELIEQYNKEYLHKVASHKINNERCENLRNFLGYFGRCLRGNKKLYSTRWKNGLTPEVILAIIYICEKEEEIKQSRKIDDEAIKCMLWITPIKVNYLHTTVPSEASVDRRFEEFTSSFEDPNRITDCKKTKGSFTWNCVWPKSYGFITFFSYTVEGKEKIIILWSNIDTPVDVSEGNNRISYIYVYEGTFRNLPEKSPTQFEEYIQKICQGFTKELWEKVTDICSNSKKTSVLSPNNNEKKSYTIITCSHDGDTPYIDLTFVQVTALLRNYEIK